LQRSHVLLPGHPRGDVGRVEGAHCSVVMRQWGGVARKIRGAWPEPHFPQGPVLSVLGVCVAVKRGQQHTDHNQCPTNVTGPYHAKDDGLYDIAGPAPSFWSRKLLGCRTGPLISYRPPSS